MCEQDNGIIVSHYTKIIKQAYLSDSMANIDKVLGISPNATQQEIRNAYKR